MNDVASTTDTLVLDIETAPLPELLTPEAYAAEGRSAPANYKNPEAIAKWAEGDRAEWLGGLGLSPRTGRIVSIGWDHVARDGTRVVRTQTAAKLDERALVGNLLEMVRRTLDAPGGLVVTFNGVAFDLHFLGVRAAILGVAVPDGYRGLLRKYATAPGVDLYGVLTGWGASARKGDGLKNWARAFGIPVADDASGADVARFAAEGRFEEIAAHNASDVQITRALFERVWGSALV